MTRPIIGITMGDPASIGPEIVIKALRNPAVMAACRPLVIGDTGVLSRYGEMLGLDLRLNSVDDPARGRYELGTVDVYDLHNVDMAALRIGAVQAMAGRASFEYIDASVKLTMAGALDGVATAPINKESIKAGNIPFIGHTEMYADLTNTTDPLTMFQVLDLRIFFLTRHVSLADAIKMIKRERIVDYIRRTTAALMQLGLDDPSLAVAGLNPHSGEHGLFGDEEMREIEPAVAEARAEGFKVSGPVPADSVFHLTRMGRYDAVLSLYHDQGHIAAKTLDFERTVSVTCGLPFLRASVDHGTALDIAGKGLASAVSMEEAILVAARYCDKFKNV